jgi:hypothetical protein
MAESETRIRIRHQNQILLVILICVLASLRASSQTITNGKKIHELPIKDTVKSDFLFMQGNNINGKLYKTPMSTLISAVADSVILDTTSLSNRIDLKLNKSDTVSLSNRINVKMGYSDTAGLSNRINLKENAITAGTTSQYWRGDKSWQTLTIPSQFNPIAGSNVTITGTYPNITFASSGGGGGGSQTLDQTLNLGNSTDTSIVFNFTQGATVADPPFSETFIQVDKIQDNANQTPLKFQRWTDNQNSGATINNEGFSFGFNIEGEVSGQPGIFESWESGYYPDAGSARWTEKHEIFRRTTGVLTRLSSYTIPNDTTIDFYHTVGSFTLRSPGTVAVDYLSSGYNSSTNSVGFSLADKLTNGINFQTNGTDNIVFVSPTNNVSDGTFQFQGFENIRFDNALLQQIGTIDGIQNINNAGSYINVYADLNIMRSIGSVSKLNFAYDQTNTSNTAYISSDGGSGEWRFWQSSGGFYTTFYSNGSERMQLTTNGNLLIGTTSNDNSALLNVSSTTKGFLPPRMTTTQKSAISSPAEGLTVYDTTLHKLYVYDGSTWQAAW